VKIGQAIQVKPNPDKNIWELAIIAEIGDEVKCFYWINRVKHEFSFWCEGCEEDKQVRL
jgi:hypothetical protein